MASKSKTVNPQEPIIETLVIKKFGDSWYIPLLKFFRLMKRYPGDPVYVQFKDNRITITPNKPHSAAIKE